MNIALPPLRNFYKLKNIERANSVGHRKESPAEHSWSCLILADYFLNKIKNQELDRLKVYELLMYHDVVEIEAGDVNLLNEQEREHKAEREKQAAHVLQEHLPMELGQKFLALFSEYEQGKTKEAKFARAVDALDAVIHELDYPNDWKGWTEDFLRKKKEHLFNEFPELKEMFEEILQFCREKNIFNH